MFVAKNPYARLGEVIDTGHCLRHVQVVAGVPHSSKLRRGQHVLTAGDDLPRGVAIGTFGPNGRYTNATDGSAHTAILVERVPEGLRVVDAWVGKPVGERIIRNKGGQGLPVDDASRYHLIDLEGV